MQKLLKISQQTFWQILVKAITASSGFIILGIISRNYGEAGVGNFTLALAYLTFFYTLADFGFNAHVIKKFQISNDKLQVEWRKLLGARILWSLLLTLLASLLLLILPSQFSMDFKLTSFLGSLIIIFFAAKVTVLALFQLKHRYDLDILPTLFGVLVGTILIFYFSLLKLPIYLVIFGYALTWFINSSGALLFAKKFSKSLMPIFDFLYIKSLFRATWPIAGTLILDVVYFRVDAFVLSSYYPASEVGIYNFAYQIFQSLLVLPTFIMNSFYPTMLEAMKNRIDRFKFQIKIAGVGLLICSLAISAATYYLSPLTVQLISGSGFEGSILSLRILSFGFPAYFLSALLMWILIAKGLYKRMLLVYAFGLVFNLAANLIFIPQYSYIAASWITGISEYLILVMQVVVLFLA